MTNEDPFGDILPMSDTDFLLTAPGPTPWAGPARGAEYDAWMTANVPREFEKVYGQCAKYVRQMVTVFPELHVRAGYYFDFQWGMRQHWWLETPDGTVIDPTAHQFPSKGRGPYEVLEPGDRPVGICMDCGADVFNKDPETGQRNDSAPNFCNARCERTTRAYMGI